MSKINEKKYHFFIPDGEMIIHWSDTLEGFKSSVQHKREFEPQFKIFQTDPKCCIFTAKGMIYVHLDCLMRANNECLEFALTCESKSVSKLEFLFVIPVRGKGEESDRLLARISTLNSLYNEFRDYEQDPFCRVLDTATNRAADLWLSEILRSDEQMLHRRVRGE